MQQCSPRCKRNENRNGLGEVHLLDEVDLRLKSTVSRGKKLVDILIPTYHVREVISFRIVVIKSQNTSCNDDEATGLVQTRQKLSSYMPFFRRRRPKEWVSWPCFCHGCDLLKDALLSSVTKRLSNRQMRKYDIRMYHIQQGWKTTTDTIQLGKRIKGADEKRNPLLLFPWFRFKKDKCWQKEHGISAQYEEFRKEETMLVCKSLGWYCFGELWWRWWK